MLTRTSSTYVTHSNSDWFMFVTRKVTVRYSAVRYITLRFNLLVGAREAIKFYHFSPPHPFAYIHVHKRNYFSTRSTSVFFRLSFTISYSATSMSATTPFPHLLSNFINTTPSSKFIFHFLIIFGPLRNEIELN